MRFAAIPAGSFVMGSPLAEPLRFNNEVPHRVRLTRAFELEVMHVTVAEFEAFVAATAPARRPRRRGGRTASGTRPPTPGTSKPARRGRTRGSRRRRTTPVVDVSWPDATAFCRWMTAAEGRTCRLPTEAEWEYACRAGSQAAYVWGDDPDGGAGWANALDQSAKDRFALFPPFGWSDGFVYTSPAGSFKANRWGLHDMLGNALQWCSDAFGDYRQGEGADPAGHDGPQRNLRGGAFVYRPKHTRCAFRGRNDPDFCNVYVGFRVLREP